MGIALPIRALVPEGVFDPETIELLVSTFERVCRTLSLDDAADSRRTVVAMKIIFVAKRGVSDPEDLYLQTFDHVLRAL